MTQFTLIGADCEAYGHPSICSEPAPGAVEQEQSHGVTVNGTQVATVNSANINIPTHCHEVQNNSCVDCYSHSVDPRDADRSSSVTINGSDVYLTQDNVQSDPGTGSNINIINTGGNDSVSESP